MSRRIVLFGATGYTGRRTAEALVDRGARPLLVGRDRARLETLAGALGGLEVATADAADPGTIGAVLRPGDVLVSTVGPFLRFGLPAVEAAVTVGAHYLDSTGEAGFVRRVFEEYGPRARASGAALLTAFGFDFVPGNLAGALALADAGESAGITRLDVGYFLEGDARAVASSGTRASMLALAFAPAHAYRQGRLEPERVAARRRSFHFDGRTRDALSLGAAEQFTLPRLHPELREVGVYLGVLGPATRAVHGLSWALPTLGRVPGAANLVRRLQDRELGARRRPADDAAVRCHIVAEACNAAGRVVSRAHLTGPGPYAFTAAALAWGATCAARDEVRGTGALGPVEAFGLAELTDSCARAGLVRV